nr:unnamed protein product [Digitaria exilis]
MPGVPAAGDGESQRMERAAAVLPPPPAADGAADDGESQPEKELNLLVRIIATAELVGDALGKLASLWATFVFLGGYRSSSSLKQVDFWIATAIVFLEAFREQ